MCKEYCQNKEIPSSTLFRKLDTGENGKINKKEFKKGVKEFFSKLIKSRASQDEILEKMFDEIDKDGD